MSAFDPAAFLESTVTGANDTRLAPIPVGEYVGVVDNIDIKPPKESGQSPRLEITWVLNDGALAAELGRDKIQVKQSVFLDVTPDGRIDMGKGKNVRLGRVREATGHNDPMKPFSVNMLRGSAAKLKITQRPDPSDSSTIYNDVGALAPLV